jgi:hypothetical protein
MSSEIPESIPQWAWDEAKAVRNQASDNETEWDRLTKEYSCALHVLTARAILKAREEALSLAASIAENMPWDDGLESFDDTRSAIASAIRQLLEKQG